MPERHLTAGRRPGGWAWRVALGKRIVRLRTALGLSRAALARAAGVPASTLAGWESGRHRSLLEMMGPLARALGVTADQLFGPRR